MKVIISPAKTMQTDPATMPVTKTPAYLEQTRRLLTELKKLSFAELKKLYQASDNITLENKERFAAMNLTRDLTAAIFAYQGQVFQHIKADEMDVNELDYLQEHLRILSGFYGLVKPFDGIVPYRLEMGNKLPIDEHKNLYEFWGDALYRDLFSDEDIVINLASKEYAQVISKHLKKDDQFITVEFSKLTKGKLRQLGMMSKSGRGAMVRFMAENQVDRVENLKEFSFQDLFYSEEYSDQNTMVFLKQDAG